MLQEQFNEFLEKLETYKLNLDNSEQEKEEYLSAIIDDFEAKEELFLSETLTLEEWYDQWRDQQDWKDGGFRDVMFPDVDEDDQEYPDDYDPYDNDAFLIHSKLLDELAEYLEL